jgi:hypothetical protein
MEDAIRHGTERVRRTHWKRLPLLTRARIAITYGLARLLMSFYGFERY